MTFLTFLRTVETVATSTPSYLPAGSTSYYPEIAVQIDFDTDPADLPRDWTDVTSYVRLVAYSRGGRNHELQRADAGTLTAVLDNRDGEFDPTNTGSTFYPGVKRMRWIRVMARWGGVEYPRWQGLIEAWTQQWPAGGLDATVTVRATDAFKVAALYDMGGQSYDAAYTGIRVDEVLDAVGLPHTYDVGQTEVVATDDPISTGTTGLSHLQDVTETENGLLFANASGEIVFQDRHYRLTGDALTSTATIGDIAGEIPYREGVLDYDDAEVWPTVEVTPSGGTAETASNATSQALHFDRVLQRNILSDSQAEALAAAQWLSGLYADPAPRIPQLELLPQTATTFWPTVLAAENSQRFTWRRRAAATIELDVFLERVIESQTPGRGWTVAWQLSPASDQLFWVLGKTGFTELNDTTTLAY